MKNSLLVPVVFIANFLIWICVLSLLAQLGSYEAISALLKAKPVLFFTNTAYQALTLTPLAATLSFLNVFFFLMRHKSLVFLTLPFVLLLSVFSILILFPFSYGLLAQFSDYHASINAELNDGDKNVFSPGFIHDDSEFVRVVWYTESENQEGVSPVVVVNSRTSLGLPVMKVYPVASYSREKGNLTAESEQIMEHAGGQDPSVIESIQLPFFLDDVTRNIHTVLDFFHGAYNTDVQIYRLIVGCFLLAVLALWVLVYATGWRLLNALLILTAYSMLFTFFPYTNSGNVYETVRGILPEAVGPVLLMPLFYLSFSVLLLVTALIVLIKRMVTHSRLESSHG